MFKKIVLFTDMFGIRPRLLIDNQKSYKTILGGSFSILMIIFSILTAFGFGSDIFLRKNPIVTLNREFTNDLVQNYTQNMVFAFSFFLDNGTKLDEPERYFQINFVHGIINDNVRKKGIATEHEHFNMTRCSNSRVYRDNLQNFTSNLLADASDYFCLQDDFDKKLIGVWGGSTSENYQLGIEICKNTTENGNNCYSENYIRSYLSIFTVHFIYSNTYVDSRNYENPLNYYLNTVLYKGSSVNYRREFFSYKKVEYMSDSGLILSSDKIIENFQVSSTKSESLPDPKTNIFVKIIISLDSLKDVYTRKYLKIQEIVANVGGFIKFFSIVFSTILSYYSQYFLVDSLYSTILNKLHYAQSDSKNKLSMNLDNNTINPKLTTVNHSEAFNNNYIKPPIFANIKKPLKLPIYTYKKLNCIQILFRYFFLYNHKKNSDRFYLNYKITQDYYKTLDVRNIMGSLKKITFLFKHFYNENEFKMIKLYDLLNLIDERFNFMEKINENSVNNEEARKGKKIKSLRENPKYSIDNMRFKLSEEFKQFMHEE